MFQAALPQVMLYSSLVEENTKEKRVLLEQGTQLSAGQEKGILHFKEDEFHESHGDKLCNTT